MTSMLAFCCGTSSSKDPVEVPAGGVVVAPKAFAIKPEAGASLVGVIRSRTGGLGWLTFGRNLTRLLPNILVAGDFDAALVGWQGVAGSHRALRASDTPWLFIDRGPPVYSSILGRLQ